MRTLIGTALALSAVFSVGCGDATSGMEAGEHTESARSAIIDGTPSGTDDDAVVTIGIHTSAGKMDAWCSGTLVAPNLVLTARHCVSTVQAGAGVECSSDGDAVLGAKVLDDHPANMLHVYLGAGALQKAWSETTASTPKEAAHGIQLIEDDATQICNDDIALIVLDHDVVGTYAPLHYDRPAVNDVLTAVGFGLTESNLMPSSRLKRAVTVDQLGPYSQLGRASVSIGDGEILLTDGPCHGDSGGPLFNANHAVLGVFSRMGGGTGSGQAGICIGTATWSAYETIGNRRALIESAFVAAGKPVWLEGEANPFLPAPAAETDQAPLPDDPTPAAHEVTSGGCNTSSRGAPGQALTFVVALGIVLAARRRR